MPAVDVNSAGISNREAVLAADKERRAEFDLQLFQALTQGRLGNIETLRGLAEALFLCNGDDVFDYFGIYVKSLPSISLRSIFSNSSLAY